MFIFASGDNKNYVSRSDNSDMLYQQSNDYKLIDEREVLSSKIIKNLSGMITSRPLHISQSAGRAAAAETAGATFLRYLDLPPAEPDPLFGLP